MRRLPPADPPALPLCRRAWLQGVAAGWLASALPQARAQGGSDDFATFDRLPGERVDVTGGGIRIGFGTTEFALPRERIVAYVRQSAASVIAYFGRFPARETRLLILHTDSPGRMVRSGTAFGDRGAAIKLVLAGNVTEGALERDWILVHEMCHLALPSVPRRHHWIEEGMASYVEPLARAQAGVLGAEAIWLSMLKGMPLGLPQDGDRGLDHTPTWGRTYWGGALFFLLADVELRERSANAKGLQHALRAILAHGNMETDSALEPLLHIGDAATGLPVLTELHARMKGSPYPVDLDALWQRLGVRLQDQRIVFDEAAPLAAVRRALTAPFSG